jgi:hypothetical protein
MVSLLVALGILSSVSQTPPAPTVPSVNVEKLAENVYLAAATAEDRELLYRFGALVVLAGGQCAPAERAWLDRFAAALGLAAERREALEREIFPAT